MNLHSACTVARLDSAHIYVFNERIQKNKTANKKIALKDVAKQFINF